MWFGAGVLERLVGDHDLAVVLDGFGWCDLAAVECRELAEPLGDWWGTAMGFGAEGQALAALGRHEQALVALARARLIHHDLGLFGSECRNLLGMLAALDALGRPTRADGVAARAAELAERLGDAEGLASLRARLDAPGEAGDESRR